MKNISKVTTLLRCYSSAPIPKVGLPLGDCTVEWVKSLVSQKVMLQDQQDKLMKFALPYYGLQKGSNGFKAVNEKIVIDGSGDFINEIKVENLKNEGHSEKKPLPLVMLHGYGAALGLFFKNFHGLVKDQPGSIVYALDMPGFGLSSRKPELDIIDETQKHLHIDFDFKTVEHYKHIHRSLRMPDKFILDYNEFENYKKGQKELIEFVENIYVDALKRWLDVKLIDKIDLLGHSYGGYMSIAFALKYPERVNKLVLVSPGGIERSPYAITNKLRKPKEGSLVELTPSGNPADYCFLGRLPMMSPTFMKFWERNITMFDLLRLSGPVGVHKLTEYIFSKYNRNNQFDSYEELKTLSLYMYHCFSKASFSDRSILKIFSPTVVAKYPMLDRIHELKIKDSLWIYGEFDWMFNSCGEEAVKELTGYGKSAQFDVVSGSGHNLYLDNPEEFNQKVKKFLQWK